MTTSIFDDPTNSGEGTPNPEGSAGDPLADLVGDGKKFKTVEDLARAKVESDKFIEQLKREGAEMRDSLKALEGQVGKSRTIEEVLNAIKGASGEGDNQALPTTEDILKLIDSRVDTLEETRRRKANETTAQARLLEKFNGDSAKARDFIAGEAQRLGMTTKNLQELASTSPEAFTRILGLNKQPSKDGNSSFVSERNTESPMSHGKVRNAAYYAELRKELGARFYEPAIQQQRMRDATALGAKFNER